MFEGILNVTLSEEVSTLWVTQENLELPLHPKFLIHTKHKNNKMKSWTDPTPSFPVKRTHPLGR